MLHLKKKNINSILGSINLQNTGLILFLNTHCRCVHICNDNSLEMCMDPHKC